MYVCWSVVQPMQAIGLRGYDIIWHFWPSVQDVFEWSKFSVPRQILVLAIAMPLVFLDLARPLTVLIMLSY